MTAAVASVLVLTEPAHAAPKPAWKCEGGSYASPNDPGGRDVRLRLASTNGFGYAEARFVANGEHIYFDNYAGSGGHAFWVEYKMTGKTWKYAWTLGDGYGLHHSYNGDFAEDGKILTEMWTSVGIGKSCLNQSGRT
jgi:hypothetical protein